MKVFLSSSLVWVLVFASSCTSTDKQVNKDGFYTRSGIHIVNPKGEPAALRGVGLGGWLMPEGYMLKISAPDGGSPTSIEQQIRSLIGDEATAHFYEAYQANYVRQVDIEAIAEIGYDHIRLPFHYRVLFDPQSQTFNEAGFALFDEFLSWCKATNLGVILDMHATPGAQNHLNISDSDGTARLWTEPEPYQDQTLLIWEEIARRYKDEPIIIGYDLINEPVLPEGYAKEDFRAFYEQLTTAIREIDQNHILFIEGDWFATNFEGLTPPMDSNMVYAFHKYWNETNMETVGHMLKIREKFNVPLWLGETGENSNAWFFEVSSAMLENDIGWNWWTHKKYDTITAPWSVPRLEAYEKVLDYWRGNSPKPSKEDAIKGLMQFVEALKLENCEYRPDVVASLFSNDFNQTPIPYSTHSVPGTLPLAEYDIGNEGVSYSDTYYINQTGRSGLANEGRAFRNDGVDIKRSNDQNGADYAIFSTEAGEWLSYTFMVEEGADYKVQVRIASEQKGGQIRIQMNGEETLKSSEVPSKASEWKWLDLGHIPLSAGQHNMRILIDQGGFSMNELRFSNR